MCVLLQLLKAGIPKNPDVLKDDLSYPVLSSDLAHKRTRFRTIVPCLFGGLLVWVLLVETLQCSTKHDGDEAANIWTSYPPINPTP
jgi:hypothetical protein